MNTSTQLAKHIREVYSGGNWTSSNLKEQVAAITWQQATTQVYNFNTIATLVYHLGYFVDAVIKVLEGAPLTASDKLSFNYPPIHSQQDWEIFLNKTFTDAENFASLVEQLPDNKLWENFADAKYGNYYRNIFGIVEHIHYHLGQIALIKKLIQQQQQANE